MITPVPQAGWEVTAGFELRMIEVPLAAAPHAAPWPIHGPARNPGEMPEFPGSTPSKDEWIDLIAQAVQVANDYLPEEFHGTFNLWIFEDVPYAAKAIWPDLVLSSRIVSPAQWERLPWVLAHEIHHLALMQSGLLAPQSTARANILTGLLSEGIATWMCWTSGLFPELDDVFQNPESLRHSFSELRKALARPSDDRTLAPDLYHQNKWGYYAGSWIIQEVHRRYGKDSWLKLLSKPTEKAILELVDLYQRTEPAPEYSF